MKKKILSLLLACCLILPFGLSLSACGKKKTEDPADQTPTTPTKAEMIEILQEAVKSSNYTGEIQEVYTNKTNTLDYVSASETETVDVEYNIRKNDGSAVKYYVSSAKPESYTGSEYITYGTLTKKVGNDWYSYSIGLDNNTTPTKTQVSTINTVGEGYSQGDVLNNIELNLDYLLEIKDEATMVPALQKTLATYLPMYKALFYQAYQDAFTYDVDDIEVDYDVVYEDGEYKATGTIVLNKLTHNNPSATGKAVDFMVEFEVVYTKDMVIRNYSKFIYNIDTTLDVADDELTQVYIINDDVYSKTIDDSHFTKVETIVDATKGGVETYPRQEQIRIHVNGKLFAVTATDFGTKINTAVDSWITTNLIDTDVDENSTIKYFVNEDYSKEYQSSVDVMVTDFYGADLYIEISANDGKALVVTNYIEYLLIWEKENWRSAKLEIVSVGNPYTANCTYGGDEYTDKILVNGDVSTATFDVESKEYVVDLYLNSYSM